MAAISNNLKDWALMYHGFEPITVGIGLSNPNIYHSTSYAKLKQQVLVLGGITDIAYSGFEHDMTPQILSIKYETQYNTILAYNLHYFPQHYRQAILKVVIAMNKPRMQQQLPMYIDYHYLKDKIPQSEGIVRRYKVTGIRVVGNVPVADWPKAILGKSRWGTMYQHPEHRGKFA